MIRSSLRVSHRPATRPRVEGDREHEILDATLELLASVGYDRVTMDAVAQAAKASKATLYRRWDSKAHLVIDALERAKGAPQVESVDTGSLRSDLIEIACHRGGLIDSRALDVMSSVITAVQRDEEFAMVFKQRFIAPKVAQTREVYERAMQRGEISTDVDLDMLAPVLAAIILHRSFVLRQSVDAATVERIIDEIVIPAATRPPRPAAHGAHSPQGLETAPGGAPRDVGT